MTKPKSKRSKKSKNSADVSTTSQDKQSVRVESNANVQKSPQKSLLPHNMTREINLLKERVASLENLIASIGGKSTKSGE